MNKKVKFFAGLVLGISTLFSLFALAVPASAQYAVPECNAATLNGFIETNNTTQVWFEWGQGGSLSYSTPKQTFSSNSNFSQRITGLTEGTLYSYRAMSTNSTGKTITFTTNTCTPTPPTPPTNTLPKGYLDGASCDNIWGWSIDFDSTNTPVNVQIYKDGPAGSGTFVTSVLSNMYRSDVNATYNLTGNHAFNIPTPSAFRDTNPHTIYAYGVDVQTGTKVLLNNAPRTISACVATPPPPPAQTCQDPSATNYGGSLPCRYPTPPPPPAQTCQDPSATNYGGSLPCRYPTPPPPPAQTCQDPSATNYGGSLPCIYPTPTPTPTVTLTANPSSIQQGQTSTLIWNSQNATSCSAAWTSSTAVGGFHPVSPSTTTTYSITCFNSDKQATAQATVYVSGTPQDQLPTVNLTADETRIDEGDSTRLRWTSNNATSCTASGEWSGSKALVGSEGTGSLFRDETYTITCFNNTGQSATDSVTVRVDDDDDGDRPTVDIYANPSRVNYNGSSTIIWSSDNADTCRSSGGTSGWSSSNRSRSGSFLATNITHDTTFSITCSNDNGSSSDSTTVTVTNIVVPPTNQQPTVIIYADSTNISYNSATTIRWSTVNATSCVASGGSVGWAGPKSIGPGSFYTGSLTSGRTYTITCSNGFGYATDSVFVNVRGRTTVVTPRTPPPATSLVLITSSVDRNQPIVPTLDNTRPHPGDEINYTVTYQNIGTASITNLVLRLDLPYEVDYMFSNPNNPTRNGNTLIFNLGTLRANGTGTVNVRVRVRQDAPPGALLNFPAVLSYTDPSGFPQSVSANVSAQIWSQSSQGTILDDNRVLLGANVFGAGFFPDSLFEWLIFLLLLLALVFLIRTLFAGMAPRRETAPAPAIAAGPGVAGHNPYPMPGAGGYYPRKTITTVEHIT
jgi:uncharacterized repeat protein (TIGR01451 family)